METTNDATRATAEAMPVPSIMSLYRAWSAEYDRINRKGAGFTPEQVTALCEPHAAMMDQICSLDSRSPLDVLAKLIAASYKLESCVDSGWVDSIRGEAPLMLDAGDRPDPLLDAISAYRISLADFNANASMDSDEEVDAYAATSYKPAMQRLEEWTAPAQTRRGAIEAIRFANEETRMFEASPMVKPMLSAALGYLEQEARS